MAVGEEEGDLQRMERLKVYILTFPFCCFSVREKSTARKLSVLLMSRQRIKTLESKIVIKNIKSVHLTIVIVALSSP